MTTIRPSRRLFRSALAPALLALLGGIAAAQPARPPASTPAPAPAGNAATPQRTTATFADWTLRCERGPTGQTCEIAQVLSAQGQPVAQIAVGRPTRGDPLQLTILVPPSVTFAQQPRLSGPGKDQPSVDMTWRRCLPGGCLAATALSDDVTRQLRARTDAAKIVYADGAGKEAALPFSPKGLAQALDALAREDAS